MSEKKFIDLGPQIAEATGYDPGSRGHLAQLSTLHWLDAHPEAGPTEPAKRTITESELDAAQRDCWHYGNGYDFREFATTLGIEVVPDPKPSTEDQLTNVIEREREGWGEAEDIARKILERFDVTPKAPGGEGRDDDQ